LYLLSSFRNASDRAKSDLSKQLDKRGVRKAIVEYLHAQLDSASSLPNSRPSSQPTPDPASQTNPFSIASFSQDTEEARAKTFGGRLSSKTPLTSSLASRGNDVSSFATAKIENDLKPITVDSTGWLHLDKSLTPDAESKSCKLEDIARDFLPNFEGKETEHNWTAREKNILALRRITKGNAPTQFTSAYLGMIKALLDGILKNVNSLRTTVSANGCLLVQEIAQAVGPGMDAMVEILLQNLVRLCGHTKKINAANGNTTISIIISHTTFHVRLLQHIWGACQDKNVQPRCFAALWLKIIISKYRHHKSTLEHGNGVEIMEKCLLKGLTDAQADVRQNMRDAYWSFQPLWPTRAET
jgi:CLIP-associating protein 1/2